MISLVTICHHRKLLQYYWLYSPYCTFHLPDIYFLPGSFYLLISLSLAYFIHFPTFSLLKVKVLVAQLCLTLCDPMNCSLLGSSVYGILQARILEWVGVPFSRGSSQTGEWTQVSHTADRFFTIWATRETQLWYLPICSLFLWAFLSFRFVHLFCCLDFTFKWNHIVLVIVWL